MDREKWFRVYGRVNKRYAILSNHRYQLLISRARVAAPVFFDAARIPFASRARRASRGRNRAARAGDALGMTFVSEKITAGPSAAKGTRGRSRRLFRYFQLQHETVPELVTGAIAIEFDKGMLPIERYIFSGW